MGGTIHQVLAGFAEGDAISSEALILRDTFREWGLESDIFVEPDHIAPGARSQCRPLPEYRGSRGELAIHHYSIASGAVDVFLRSPAKKILIYHNITPAAFFEGVDDEMVRLLTRARKNLAEVAGQTDAVWAVSRYNASELAQAGVRRVSVFPLLFSPEQFDVEPHPEVLKKFAAPMKNILFVGRMAPNKRIEDLITAFAWYHRTINRQSRLIIVGSERSAPRYYLMLLMLAHELDLPNVCFERFASPSGLASCYRLADVFVTASEHEGYCLPLVEAMHGNIPVIARNRGGIPEALGGAGVLYDDASAVELAELIDRVLVDKELRNGIVESQRRRMEEIRGRDYRAELKALLAGL